MTAVVDGSAPMTVPTVEDRLDRLSAQVEELAVELRRQREARQRWEELAHELILVSRGAMDVVSRELDDLSTDVAADDLAEFARTLVRSMPKLRTLLLQLDSLTELGGEVTSLGSAGMAKLSETLATAEGRGYFTFARGSADIVDRVVTSFSAEDVRALRENIVLILGSVKEITQPEVMGMLRRTASTAQHLEGEQGAPPSLLSLLRRMREPPTRRGLARILAMLHSVGEPGRPPTNTNS